MLANYYKILKNHKIVIATNGPNETAITEIVLIEYIKNHSTNSGNIGIIEFLGNVAGRSDVKMGMKFIIL